MMPSITLQNDHDLILRFDYSANAVARIKADIPKGGYKWSKTEKAWIIHKDFLEEACEILKKEFGRFTLDKSCDAIFAEHKKVDETFVGEGL
jgi:hypothetical protein